jgi:teichuronic acid biosynthesis glycosyltransferase TuaC
VDAGQQCSEPHPATRISVLYLAWGYPSEAEPYAAPFFRNQAEALASAGANVHVVVPVPRTTRLLAQFSAKWREYYQTPARAFVNGVQVDWPRSTLIPRTNQFGIAHHFLRATVARAVNAARDVVHAHGAYPLGFTGVLAARQASKASVLTLHGSDVNQYPELGPRHQRQFQTAVRSATRVLAVSEALAERTERLSGVRPRVLPIGIDIRRFSAAASAMERAALRDRLGLPQSVKLVLYVGNLYVEKGIAELAVALRALGDTTQAVIVGDGPMRPVIEAAKNAICVGRVANDVVRDYMAACDMLVLPSYTEGMPTVVVEAGSIGLPVIGTEVGGTPELLVDERGLLIAARDARKLKEAMRYALTHPAETAAMAARLQQYVHAHYDARANAELLLGIYADAILQQRATSEPGIRN